MIESLSDDELTARLERLARDQRANLCELLEHLGEFDDRRLALPKGFPSTYEYCRTRLRFSEGEAYLRIHAARALRDHDVLKPLIKDGSLTLTAVSMLRPYLNERNVVTLASRASGRSRLELEVLVAGLREARSASEAASGPPELPFGPGLPTIVPVEGQPVPADAVLNVQSLPVPKRDSIRAVATERFEVDFQCPRTMIRALERAKEVLRHKFPFARLEEVLGLALEDLLDRRDPDRIFARRESRRKARHGPK